MILSASDFDGDDFDSELGLIHLIVTRFGKSLDTLQITGEPNCVACQCRQWFFGQHFRQALQEGVLLAKSGSPRMWRRTWRSASTQSRLWKPPAVPRTISGRPFARSETNSSNRSTTSACDLYPRGISARRFHWNISIISNEMVLQHSGHTTWPLAESHHQSPSESVELAGQTGPDRPDHRQAAGGQDDHSHRPRPADRSEHHPLRTVRPS